MKGIVVPLMLSLFLSSTLSTGSATGQMQAGGGFRSSGSFRSSSAGITMGGGGFNSARSGFATRGGSISTGRGRWTSRTHGGWHGRGHGKTGWHGRKHRRHGVRGFAYYPYWGYGGYYNPPVHKETVVVQPPPDKTFEENLRKEDKRRQSLPTSAFVKNYSWGKSTESSRIAGKQEKREATKRPL